MKKLFALTLILALSFSLAACGGSKLQEGEALYQGQASFDQVQQFELSFILTADGSEVRAVKARIVGAELSTQINDGGYSGRHKMNAGTISMSHGGKFPVQNGAVSIDLGESGSISLALADGAAAGTIHYVYVARNAYQVNGSSRNILYDLGSSDIELRAQA